jgi:hypothetical protein
MKLTPPKQITFWVSLVLGVLGILGTLVTIPVISGIAFWLLAIGFVILVLGLILKGF